MSLAPGDRLGAYEVLGLIGVGGMGEVYRARDTRLDRLVAIKVLPEQFATDLVRGERFQREARAVAALNHSHICALHDVGDVPSPSSSAGSARSMQFLVMEHLEGQTLAERLLRGPLAISEILRYAIEIADAMDHAHRRGIVHRDLKPSNVMLTESGAKLLDFGLSRLQSTPNLLALSTISPDETPLTAAGTLLGTYPYMPPEQLAGREADARSDIFAFGAMVYEMATGRRAFEGTTAATVVGAILHTDPPPVSSLQPLAPSALDRVVSRSLAKDPDDRWQTARDLVLELKWITEQTPSASDTARARRAGSFETDHKRSEKRLRLIATAGLSFLAAAGVAFGVAYFRSPPAEESAIRLELSPPAALTLASAATGGQVAISPDGQRLAFVAVDGTENLWLRPLDSLAATALPGTDGASYPFWSPDSQVIGFFAQGKLKKIAVTGGPVQTLCDAVLPRGGAWNRAGVILFSANAGRHLYRVQSAGGGAIPLTLDQPNRESFSPHFLPDGRHFIYYGRRQKPGIYLASLESKGTTPLASGYTGVEYAAPGYLLLLAGGPQSETTGTLMAQRFDSGRLQLVGDSVPVAEQVAISPLFGRGAFSVSENGRLVYATRSEQITQLNWVDREGKQLRSLAPPGSYQRLALSPDEKTVAVEMLDSHLQSPDIWTMDTTRGVTSRFTFDPGAERFPLWSGDGRWILFSAPRQGKPPTFFQKASSGAGAEELLFGSDLNIQPTDWSRDGKYIVYASLDPTTQWDLWVVSALEGLTSRERKPEIYLQTPFNEHHGHLSPDGRWMAYSSDESGRREVYVRAFPDTGARWQISTRGGVEPRWRRDGKELFYVSPDETLMVVAVQPEGAFQAGVPQALFKSRLAVFGDEWKPIYAPAGDGQRFLINTIIDRPGPSPLTIVINWPAGLSRH